MSRKKSQPPKLTKSHDRVVFIAERMSRGEWLGGYAMRLGLAKAWGISESRVRQLATSAHEVLAFDPERAAELRAELAMTCLAILAEARTRVSRVSGLPDFRAALEAAVRVAQFAGIDLEPPDRAANGVAMSIELHDMASYRAAQEKDLAEVRAAGAHNMLDSDAETPAIGAVAPRARES